MSYTEEDWFENSIQKQLKLPEEIDFEQFKTILFRALQNDRNRGKRFLLSLIVDNIDFKDVHDILSEVVEVADWSGSIQLKELHYTKDSHAITVKYNGVEE